MTTMGLERGDQVRVSCPACTPNGEQVHEVLKPDSDVTLECRACGHVHKVPFEPTHREDIRVVVSSGGESLRTSAAVPVDERLAVGEEFVAKTDEGPMGVRITSLELEAGHRTEQANAADVTTIWTRAVDNVGVPTTIHPEDGRREGTVSETYYLPGDEEIVVGEQMPLSEGGVEVERLLVRDDVAGPDPGVLDEQGDVVLAKDAKRVFARRTDTDMWRSPWDTL